MGPALRTRKPSGRARAGGRGRELSWRAAAGGALTCHNDFVAAWGRKMTDAYHVDSALEAEGALLAAAKELDHTHPGAAASLREGLD